MEQTSFDGGSSDTKTTSHYPVPNAGKENGTPVHATSKSSTKSKAKESFVSGKLFRVTIPNTILVITVIIRFLVAYVVDCQRQEELRNMPDVDAIFKFSGNATTFQELFNQTLAGSPTLGLLPTVFDDPTRDLYTAIVLEDLEPKEEFSMKLREISDRSSAVDAALARLDASMPATFDTILATNEFGRNAIKEAREMEQSPRPRIIAAWRAKMSNETEKVAVAAFRVMQRTLKEGSVQLFNDTKAIVSDIETLERQVRSLRYLADISQWTNGPVLDVQPYSALWSRLDDMVTAKQMALAKGKPAFLALWAMREEIYKMRYSGILPYEASLEFDGDGIFDATFRNYLSVGRTIRGWTGDYDSWLF
ncbi:hypothetical protein NMY22_g4286 [Coprinellus aureogranulatus]|nr:hypothetical protein NMY22_g4286 [Coprinellus aureogranulatus]